VRILVIEDTEDNRQIIRDLLTSFDYELIEAVDGAAALFVIGTGKGQVTHTSKRWAQYELNTR